ncbi:hypothetical protein [Ensifer sp. BR816]|uniref:hypothetical protein n=1 Tax=Rhizobium sp. (strain BR816) TaxID=1057002 RepID=UPI00054EB261|nr:hypothetical protein [Ensifer sp. BR816]
MIAVEGLSTDRFAALRRLIEIGEFAGAVLAQPMVQKLMGADDRADVFVVDEIIHLERREVDIRQPFVEIGPAFRERPLLGVIAQQIAALRAG